MTFSKHLHNKTEQIIYATHVSRQWTRKHATIGVNQFQIMTQVNSQQISFVFFAEKGRIVTVDGSTSFFTHTSESSVRAKVPAKYSRFRGCGKFPWQINTHLYRFTLNYRVYCARSVGEDAQCVAFFCEGPLAFGTALIPSHTRAGPLYGCMPLIR